MYECSQCYCMCLNIRQYWKQVDNVTHAVLKNTIYLSVPTKRSLIIININNILYYFVRTICNII